MPPLRRYTPKQPKPAKVSQEFAVAGRPLHIMIVDERQLRVRIMKEALEPAGIRVSVEETPYGLPYHVDRKRPDMLLLADRFSRSGKNFTGILCALGVRIARMPVLVVHSGQPSADPILWSAAGQVNMANDPSGAALLETVRLHLSDIRARAPEPKVEASKAASLINRKLGRLQTGRSPKALG